HVEVERARIDALDAPLAQAREVAFGRGALGVAHANLLVEELARDLDVARDEDAEREAEALQHLSVQRLQLARAFVGEAAPVLYLLGGELHEVLVDDVADMLEVGREADDVGGATPLLL